MPIRIHKFAFFLIALIYILCFSTSCEDEVNEPVPENNFTLNGEIYDTPKGFIFKPETNNNNNGRSYDVGLLFGSEDVNYDEAGREYNGRGSIVQVTLYSPTEDVVVPGTYIFSDDNSAAGDDLPFTFEFAFISDDFDVGTQTGDVFEALGGEVVVLVDNDIYDISYELNISNNTLVVGTYEGNMRCVFE